MSSTTEAASWYRSLVSDEHELNGEMQSLFAALAGIPFESIRKPLAALSLAAVSDGFRIGS